MGIEGLAENLATNPALEGIDSLDGLAQGFIDLKLSSSDFKAGLPEDIRNDPSLGPIKDIPNLAKSFINAQKMVGRDKIALPGDDATEDEWSEVFKRLGRPDAADGYNLVKPTDLPEGFPFQEALVKGFSEVAHKEGLTSKQATALYKWYLESEVDAFNGIDQDQNAAAEKAETELRKKLGSGYEERMEAANMLLDRFAPDGLIEEIKTHGMANSALLSEMLISIAGQFSEDTLKGMGGPRFQTLTPESAKEEIKRLKMDKEFMDAYQNPKNPGHQAAMEKYQALYQAAYPQEEK